MGLLPSVANCLNWLPKLMMPDLMNPNGCQPKIDGSGNIAPSCAITHPMHHDAMSIPPAKPTTSTLAKSAVTPAPTSAKVIAVPDSNADTEISLNEFSMSVNTDSTASRR